MEYFFKGGNNSSLINTFMERFFDTDFDMDFYSQYNFKYVDFVMKNNI